MILFYEELAVLAIIIIVEIIIIATYKIADKKRNKK